MEENLWLEAELGVELASKHSSLVFNRKADCKEKQEKEKGEKLSQLKQFTVDSL